VGPSRTGADPGRGGSKDEWDEHCAAFGAAVRARRERLGLSQEAFAHEVDLERSYVSGIERGVRNPTLKVITRLAKALSTKPSKLLAAAGK